MAGTVAVVQTTAAGFGAEVAVDRIATTDFQQVKLVGGALGVSQPIDSTSGIAAAGSLGIVVAPLPGASVSAQVSGTISVAGGVSISAMPAVSGTVSVSGPIGTVGTLVTILSTVLVSGAVQASGTVSVSGTVPVSVVSFPPALLTTNAPSTTAQGMAVWLVGGQTATGVPVLATITGTAQVTVVPGASISAVGTILGTQIVSVAQTSLIVSVLNVTPVTTAASVSVTGIPVWFNPTQGLNVSTVSGTVNVNIAAAGTTIPVNVVAGGAAPGTTFTGQTSNTAQLVWLAQTQTLSLVSTIVTVLGTQVVTIAQTSVVAALSAIAPVTTAASVSVTGLPVWLNPTQGVNVSTVSGTVNFNLAAAGTTIPVNVVAGGAAPGTTATTQTNVTAQVVWLAPTQTIHVTIDAGAGGGGSVTTAAPSISATGQVMWVAGGQSTTVSPVYVSQINPPNAGGGSVVTTQAGGTSTGQLVWLAGTQTLALVSTVGTVLGTVNVNLAAAGTTIPVNVVAGGAAPGTTFTGQTSNTAQLVWLAQTQTLSLVSTIVTVLGTQVVTIAQTSVVASLLNVTPVTTATSVSVTGLPVWLNPTQGVNVSTVSGTVNVAIVAGAGGGGSVVTTQAGGTSTGQLVWLAATQTVTAVISGIVPVTTQTSVSVTGLPVWFAPGAMVSLINQSVAVGNAYSSTTKGALAGLAYTTASASGTGVSGLMVRHVDAIQVTGTVEIDTVATVLGTLNFNLAAVGTTIPVNVVAGGAALGTTFTGQTSNTAQLVWLAQTQTLSLVSTIVTVLGTVNVNVVAGAGGGGSVVTTQAGGTSTGQLVWLAATQTVFASLPASQVLGTVIAVSGITAVSVVSTVGTLLGTVLVSGTVSDAFNTTTQAAVTGDVVWLAPTQTVAAVSTIATILSTVNVAVVAGIPGAGLVGGYWLAAATSTALASSTQVLLMSVYPSSGSTLGTSGWTVGSGSALIIYNLGFGWSQAAANNQATFMLLVTATGATFSTAAAPGQAWAQVTFTSAAALSTFISTGYVPGSAVAANSSITTYPFPWVIPGPAVVGLAVAATSSGATAYAVAQASVVGSVPFVQPVIVAGSVVVSGQVVATTTQASGVTGAVVYLAASQTLVSVATVATVLGTVLVSQVAGAAVTAVISGVAPVTTAASVSVTGLPVWLNPTQTLAVSGALFTTGIATIASTGRLVVAKDFARLPVVINITSTVAGASSMMLLTVQTGGTTGAAAGVSTYIVPAGKVLRIIAANFFFVSSATLGPAQAVVVLGTAAISVSLTATVGMAAVFPYAVQATTQMAQFQDWANDILGGTTMGVAISGASHSLLGAVIQGFLF